MGVDPQSRERIFEMLERLRLSGVSLMLTTHQLDEAEARCQRVVIIDHGVVVASGTVPELVAGSVGAGWINLRRDSLFLLFSSAREAGSLLEESESGTLERVLSSQVGMSGLLAGKWLFLTLLGAAQVTVMFTWGAVVFHLPLARHLAGFAIVTSVTAAAAAAFSLVLATATRSRAQLGGLSTFVIMIVSAVGGSMFPRFLMSEAMQRLGLLTFNAWAIDGYLKVFWRQAPLLDLWPQVAFLAGATVVFLGIARLLERRWEPPRVAVSGRPSRDQQPLIPPCRPRHPGGRAPRPPHACSSRARAWPRNGPRERRSRRRSQEHRAVAPAAGPGAADRCRSSRPGRGRGRRSRRAADAAAISGRDEA